MAEPADFCTKSYTGTPVSSASCHSMNHAVLGPKSTPQMVSDWDGPWPSIKKNSIQIPLVSGWFLNGPRGYIGQGYLNGI